MAVMKADDGWNVLIFIGNPGSEPNERWSKANVRRVPVLAWQIENNGLVIPVTLMQWLTAADTFVVETPELAVITYGRSHPNACLYRDNLDAYLDHMRETLAHTPQEAVQAETQH